MKRARDHALVIACAAFALAFAGCNNPSYLAPPNTLEVTPGGPGGVDDHYTIPIRKPTAAEQPAVGTPWVGVRDLAVELQISVENLGADPTRALVSLVGGSEFGTYDPQSFVDPLDPNSQAPPPLITEAPIDLQAGATSEIIWREDQIAEAALDVEAIVRYPSTPAASTPFKVVTVRSDVSRTGLENVPAGDVVPQMIVYTLHLAAGGHVRASWMVRVRDLHGRLAPPGATDLFR